MEAHHARPGQWLASNNRAPPPLRTRRWLWGLSAHTLSAANAKRVEEGNLILVACLQILGAVAEAGGSVTLEHPADPGTDPYPSIWALQLVLEWETTHRLRRVHFPQCMWGCHGRKNTTIISNLPNASELERPCNHT